MRKADIAILERAWIAEMTPGHPGLVPFGKKTGDRLEADGLLEYDEITDRSQRIPVLTRGYRITHKGIMGYADWVELHPELLEEEELANREVEK